MVDAKRSQLDSGDVFKHAGRMFRFEVHHDDCMREPWKENDGHGVVSEWTSREKAPGERVLNHDGGSYRYYDVQATLKLAKADGWGVGDDELIKREATVGRKLTKAEVVSLAVERDFERLRGWCQDEWTWAFVEVTLLKADDDAPDGFFETKHHATLGGIESDSGDYLTEVGHELADEILSEVSQ